MKKKPKIKIKQEGARNSHTCLVPSNLNFFGDKDMNMLK